MVAVGSSYSRVLRSRVSRSCQACCMRCACRWVTGGNPFALGESGVLPVAFYLVAAAAVLGLAAGRGHDWREFATQSLR
jgi:hypothetical protein